MLKAAATYHVSELQVASRSGVLLDHRHKMLVAAGHATHVLGFKAKAKPFIA